MNAPLGPMDRTADDALSLRLAMRRLVGGVSVVTAGIGEERTGLTATSVVSLTMEPPTMLVCVNRATSAWPVILRHRHFCINVLHAGQVAVAERFAGRGGVRGAARYDGADWITMGSGASGLAGALAVIDCTLEDVVERHSHGIVIGAVRDVRGELGDGSALVYGHGRFGAVNLL